MKELLLADFTADNAQYDLTSFTKIDHQTYSLAFPDTFYQFSTLTLSVTVARGNDGSEITKEYKIKSVSGKTPEDATVSDTPIIACPAIIEVEAGVIYTMKCALNKVSGTELSLVT